MLSFCCHSRTSTRGFRWVFVELVGWSQDTVIAGLSQQIHAQIFWSLELAGDSPGGEGWLHEWSNSVLCDSHHLPRGIHSLITTATTSLAPRGTLFSLYGSVQAWKIKILGRIFFPFRKTLWNPGNQKGNKTKVAREVEKLSYLPCTHVWACPC